VEGEICNNVRERERGRVCVREGACKKGCGGMWGIEILANFRRLIYLQQKKKHLCTLLSRGGVDRPSPT
jgi:hypothetical protein